MANPPATTTIMIENPFQRTAVHESGHAVAAMHLNVAFEAVEVRVDAVYGFWHCGGRLRGAELPDSADNDRLWAQLTVIMAGFAAESLFAPSAEFSVRQFAFPDDRDFGAAVEILRSMQPPVTIPGERDAAMERAWSDARRIVAANGQRLTTIANELLRLGHRDGEMVACHIVLTPKALSLLMQADR